jgi:outer membrane protein assembly factor BamB
VLENGNILLFDNGFEQSRILEIDPQTNHIVWSYGPNGSFFSETRGSNQRLPNGNTLITESDSGYVFEVTQTGETVWKFANPIVDEDTSEREAIWRMKRFDPAELAWLE